MKEIKMAILRVKNLNLVSNTLYLFLEDNNYYIENDVNKISRYVQLGLKFFKDYPNGILEIDTDKIDNVKYYNHKNICISYNPGNLYIQSLKINNKSLVFNTDSLSKYFAYAKKYNFLQGFNKFIEKISNNKHKQSMQDLTEFLANNNLPLTNNGDILAFKMLHADGGVYTDCHTGLIEQKVGDRVKMPRQFVTLDKSKHCATGLHVADFNYANEFSNGEVFLVKVNVDNVVSVPNDISSKIRVCEYDIIYKLTQHDRNCLESNNFSTDMSSFLYQFIKKSDFKLERIINLKKSVVGSHSDIDYQIIRPKNSNKSINIKDIKITDNKYVSPVLNVSKLSSNEENTYLNNLNKVINCVSKINESISQDEAEFIIKFYKSNKKKISWRDLGINDKMRKKIYRIAKIYH